MFEYQLISFHRCNIKDQSDLNHINTNEWYQYVIANSFNQITGYRSGKADEVKKYIDGVLAFQNQKLLIKQASFEKHSIPADYLES